jgi:hypothetical protein
MSVVGTTPRARQEELTRGIAGRASAGEGATPYRRFTLISARTADTPGVPVAISSAIQLAAGRNVAVQTNLAREGERLQRQKGERHHPEAEAVMRARPTLGRPASSRSQPARLA